MAAKADTATETYEAMTAASNQAMKDGVEKAVAAFGDLSAFSKNNVEAMMQAMTTAGKGVEQVSAQWAAFSKTAMEDGVTAAKRIAGAKSVQEVLELQTDYARSSLDAYIGEMTKLTDVMSGAVKDSFKPLNERVNAAVEIFQASR